MAAILPYRFALAAVLDYQSACAEVAPNSSRNKVAGYIYFKFSIIYN